MLKISLFSLLLGLCFCFVYTESGNHSGRPILAIESQIPRRDTVENNNLSDNVNNIDDKQSSRPCKQHKNRRSDENEVISEYALISAKAEQLGVRSDENNVLLKTTPTTVLNNYNEHSKFETDTHKLHPKGCKCASCVSETEKNATQSANVHVDYSDNIPIMKDASLDTVKHVIDDNLNKNTRRKKCGSKFQSEIPLNSPSRRIIPGLLESTNDQDLKDNNQFQNAPPFRPKENLDEGNTQTEERQNFPNVHKITNNYSFDRVNNMNNIKETEQRSDTDKEYQNQLPEPTKGKGVYDMKDAVVMLMEHARVCYACSTYNDPTCWAPDRRTTVKYCQRGHESCLTNSFDYGGIPVKIRDCGNSCGNGEGSYKSCSICHSDFCNSASTVSVYDMSITAVVILGIVFNKN